MFQEIIVLVFVYVCLVGWANAPKSTTTDAPIAVPTESTTAQDLTGLSIRELYALSSAKGVKRYKSKSKAELIQILS